jgi:hypothetical protein
MSDKPLLEKGVIVTNILDRKGVNKRAILQEDVLECLKKFKNAYMYDLCGSECDICKDITAEFYDEDSNKEYCFDCWFKECFGVLPEDKKEAELK